MKTLAVVSNYKRTANTWAVVKRLAEDGQCDIIVADNSPSQEFEFVPNGECGGNNTFPQQLIDVWRWKRNSGPPARWYPALAFSHQYEYIAIVDDDHMPSHGLIGALEAQAAEMNNQFAVIGRIGRNFGCRRGRWRYRRHNVWDGQVDMAGAGYFVCSESLIEAVKFRDELAGEGFDPYVLFQDDLILNCAIQREFKVPSWMPKQRWSESRMNTLGYAFSATEEYSEKRDLALNACHAIGWRPIPRETTA